MNFFKLALDYLFPPCCVICGKLGKTYVCTKCEIEIKKYLYNNYKNELENNEDIFYLFQYKGIIRDKIIQYKFYNQSYIYHMFCESFMKNEKGCKFLRSYDIIIPVPIHKKRKLSRGYNQSELIARRIARDCKKIIYNNVLIKQKNIKPQSLMDKKDRMNNVQGVYKVDNKEKIQGKNIVILDDVYTTGATIHECKKKLIEAGAKKVGIIIIAKD